MTAGKLFLRQTSEPKIGAIDRGRASPVPWVRHDVCLRDARRGSSSFTPIIPNATMVLYPGGLFE